MTSEKLPAGHPFAGMIKNGYGAIGADPAWNFKLRSAKGEKKSPQAHYDCMALPDIHALPVADLAARDCVLFLWATFPMIQQALDTMAAWGFTYSTGGAWAKQSSTGAKWAFGAGFRLRSAAECFFIGTRGKPPIRSHSVRNLIIAPTQGHSRKPDDHWQPLLEQIAAGPYCELFGRGGRHGWTSWGNEAGKFGAPEGSIIIRPGG